MDLKVEKGYFMKSFYSIFSIFLCILCILVLFLYPRQDSYLLHDFSTKVLAKEIPPNTHQTLSDAHTFSRNQTYQVKLSAYNSFYGCISFDKKIHFIITSNSIQNLKISLFADTGKKLSCQTAFTKKTCTISPSQNTSGQFTRIFLCVKNQSTSNCSVFILAEQAKGQKSSVSKNSNQATPKPKQNNTTSNPKINLSTVKSKKIILYPQFLVLIPNSKYKLSIKENHQNCAFSNFTFISSNSSIASVKDGKVFTHREGTAILYICNKKNSAITSSCFLRVLRL